MALVSVPILMVCLSLLLPARTTRILTLVTGTLYVPVSIGNVVGETWLFLYLGALVEVGLLLAIVWLAWSWPRAAMRAQ